MDKNIQTNVQIPDPVVSPDTQLSLLGKISVSDLGSFQQLHSSPIKLKSLGSSTINTKKEKRKKEKEFNLPSQL